MNRLQSLFRISCAVGLCVAAFSLCAAEPPHLIPFQGHLAKPDGEGGYAAVPSGQYDVLFTLYAAPVGGESKVWGPERHSGVVIVNGLANAMLGSVVGFEDALAANANFFARPLYVGITIDADGSPSTADLELVPRQVLLPGLYAHNANRLDGADWRAFFVGTDNEGTFTDGTTKARDADKLDGADWRAVFDNGDPTTGRIDGSRLADNSVTSGQLASGIIGPEQIAEGAIGSDQIADGAVSGADLADGIVTITKVEPRSVLAGPYILKSSQYVDLWSNFGGEKTIDFDALNLVPDTIPPQARGVIIKVIVFAPGSGSTYFADEDGLFAEGVIHYRQNGVTSYETWGGAPVYVPFHDGRKIILRTDSNSAGSTDAEVRSYGTLIGWY